ncbi:MAG: CHAD domain-containing protein [Afipia sp.]|nr:CHAD domain-containing protein [Afipia sp.]
MMVDPQAPPIAHSLREVADDILATARAAQERLQEPLHSGKPSAAIHDLRVALKRWQALLRLLEGPIGDEVMVLRHEARLLARAFGRSRDAQSVLDALADIAKQRDAGTPAMSKRTEATITQRLRETRDASEAAQLNAEVHQHLRNGVAQASACLASWPLERIDFEDIVTALARSYRRARRRLPRKWEDMEPEAIHDFRKAVVTFRYQLDLIAPLWPKVWRAFIDEVQRVRMQLGRSNDLVALSLLTQPNQPLAHWRSRLTPPIESRRRLHLERARLLSGRVFAESPRSFRKRIETLAKAAADLG